MKSIIFLFFLFLFIPKAYGQDEVLRKDDSLRHLFRQANSDTLKVKILEELSILWKNKSFIRSIEYTKEAIEFSKKHLQAHTLGLTYQLAFAYMQVGDAVRSIDIFNQIIRELDGKYPEGYSMALAFIAMNYETLGDINKALELQIQAGQIYDDLLAKGIAQDRRGILGNPHKMAVYYLKNNQLDSALHYGQKAIDALKTEPLNDYNRFFSWYIKTTMGDIYYALHSLDKAMAFYTDAEQEVIRYNSKEDLPLIYLGMSKVYVQKNEISLAKRLARQSYFTADTLNLIPLVKETALYLKTIYSRYRQMDSALFFYEISMAAKDSIFKPDIARKIDAMEFEEERRSQEQESLQQEKSFHQKQTYLLTGILTSLVFAAFFYHKNQLKQKANQLLDYQNKEIFFQRDQLQKELEQLEIKALKAQMNPHFIFNCINSIDAFIYSNDKYMATLYLNKFAKLLRNILDSSKNNTVSLSKDIETLRLYTDLEELRHGNKFTTQYQVDEELLNNSFVVPPLIIQPLVENAILHGLKNRPGNTGLLNISISREEEYLKYEITDNGIGRAAAAKIIQHKENSYGTELTRARIKMFNQDTNQSLEYIDLADAGGHPAGTRVIVRLNLQTA